MSQVDPVATEHSTGGAILVASAVTALGPLVGPYVVILVGSVWGGMLAVTTAESVTRQAGALVIVRAVLMGVGFSQVMSWVIARWLPPSWSLNADGILFAVAVFTGWSADKLGAVRDRLLWQFSKPQDKP